MTELFQLETERARIAAPIEYEALVERYGLDVINRASAVHDSYIVQGGKSREMYMERLGIEYKKDYSLTKQDLDLIDGYLEHRRFLRARSKALYRDWERDKRDLKDKTVKMIEEEVAETREKLMKELELYRVEAKQEKKHAKLDIKRKDYEEKMKIIEEIELEKKHHEESEKEQKETLARQRAEEAKERAKEYK